MENKLSYDLFGDVSEWIPDEGWYTLKAIPYILRNGEGEEGTSRTIRFEVVFAEPRTMMTEMKTIALEKQAHIEEEVI